MTDKQTFEQRLRSFSHARRGLLNAALGFRLSTWGVLAGIAALVLLSGMLPGAFVNLALFAGLLLFLLGLITRYALRRNRFRSPLDEAFRIEALAGNLRSRLISAWDFLHEDPRSPLMQVVVTQAATDLQQQFEKQLDRRDRDRLRKRFAIIAVIFLAIGLTPWFGFARVANNLVQSWLAAREYLFPVEFIVTPGLGRHIHRLGDKVEVGLEFKRPGFEEVRLMRRIGDAPPTSETLKVDEHGRARTVITSPAEAEHLLHFEFGERATGDVTLVFTTPPSLVNMETELVYPAYTRLLPRTLEGVQQRLLGLPGTRITLGFTFSKELESATITWDDGETLPLETVGRFATLSMLHNQTRQASLQVKDEHGFALDYPLTLEFELQTDDKPQLFLPKHLVADMPLLENAVGLFGFGARAQDDYGITRCLLKWQKSTVENPASVTDQGEIERVISPAQRTVVANFEKFLDGMNLRPGDRLEFFVEASDNRTPTAQVTRSRRCSIFVYQEDLGALSIASLGFGPAGERQQRIPKSTRATTVKTPEGRRNSEKVRNEFEANVVTSTRAPTVTGQYGQATRDYFRLLSNVGYEETKKPAVGGAASPATPPTGTLPPDGTIPPNDTGPPNSKDTSSPKNE